MTETKTRTAHFSVCGEGITGIVRRLYCFEDNKEGAMSIMSSFPGMKEEQMIKVCTGDAHLTDMREDGTMGYVEKPDPSFKHEYHNFMLQKERRARKIKEAEEAEREELEAAAEKNHISPESQRWVNEQNPYHDQNKRERDLRKLSARGRQSYDAGIPVKTKDGEILQNDDAPSIRKASLAFETAMAGAARVARRDPDGESRSNLIEAFTEIAESFKEPTLPVPSKETIRVGRWDVPKNYLDRYANEVVKSIRYLIRMQGAGVLSIDKIDPIRTYNLEMERQILHNAICDAIGVPHNELGKENTPEQTEFSEAFDAYIDEHSGKLFNGDE